MPLVNSYYLLLSHSLTSVTASYFLLTDPALVLSSTPVWLLGESMHIREPASKYSFSASEPMAALALVLFLTACTQLVFASGLAPVSVRSDGKAVDAGELGEKVYTLRYAQNQWLGLAGGRVLFMGALVGWIYILYADRGQSKGLFSANKGGISLLANRAVFAAAMADMLFWGYVWTVIREEGRELAMMVFRLREDREDE